MNPKSIMHHPEQARASECGALAKSEQEAVQAGEINEG